MSLNLSIPKSELLQDSETVLAPLELFDNFITSACDQLNASMDLFWGLPDERLLAWLNAKGPLVVQEVFNAHAAHATALNQILADRGKPARAIIGARRALSLDAQGQFFIEVPVVEEVIAVEPEVEFSEDA